MMKKIVSMSLLMSALSSADAVSMRSNLDAILGGGAYATVTDVKAGSVCILNEIKAGNNPIPSECECTFNRLQNREKECATLSLIATAEETKKCTEVPCQVCCILKYSTLPGAEANPAHLDCKKKCPGSEYLVKVTEDSATAILQKLMEFGDIHYPLENEEIEKKKPAVAPLRKQSVKRVPPPAVASYQIVTFPSEEEAAATGTIPLTNEDSTLVSAANNILVAAS